MKISVLKRIMCMVLALCMLFGFATAELILPEAAAASTSYYGEDFNNITQLDWIPKNHSNATPSADDSAKVYASIEADPKDGTNQVMKLTASDGASHCVGAVRELSATPDIGVLKYKLYLGNNASYLCLPSFRYVANGSQGSWYFSIMANGNKLMLVLCQASSVKQFVYTSSEELSDEWHDIALVQKTTTGKTLDYAFYVDNLLVTEGQLNQDNCTHIANANLAMTGISWSSYWSAAETYIDDLSVTEYVPASGISLADTNGNTSADLMMGDKVQLDAAVLPADASCAAITYSSSNDTVVTVDATGKVTAVASGTATITATMAGISALGQNMLTATYNVSVSDALFDSDFQEDSLGLCPEGWEVIKGEAASDEANVSVAADPQDTSNKVLTMTVQTPSGNTYIERYRKAFANNLAGTKAVLSYRFNMGYVDNLAYLPNFSDFDNNTPFEIAVKGNSVTIYNPVDKSWPSIVEIGSGEWYDVTIILDTERNVYDVYLDGQLIHHSDTENDLNGFNGIDWGFYSSAAGTNAVLSIDDLKVIHFIDASDVAVAQSDISVAVGGSVPLELVFSPENASYQSAMFTSSNEEVATVDIDGVITGIAAGTATITVIPNGITDVTLTVNVTVAEDIPVADIVLSTEEIELPVGGHIFLETSVLPENAKNQKVKLSTQNEDVIYVDEWGEIVALKAGTAEITVTADNGKVEKTVKVIVTTPGVMKTIYVSSDGTGNGENAATPASLAKALEIISQIDKAAMTGNIVVSMAEGYYQQIKTLELNETHGGNGMYSVIFQAEDGADVTIGGGIQIPGSSFAEVEGKLGVYAVELAEGIQTRQLYINNVRATRARSTQSLMGAELLYDASGTCIGYTCDDDGVLSKYVSSDAADSLEFIYMYAWYSYRCGVSSISLTADGRVEIIMDQPGFSYIFNNREVMGEPACIQYYENGIELLDEPGEWYLDEVANKLYYMPRSFEEMGEVTVTVPVVEDLVTVIGTNYDNMVQNITFQGITFADATWMRPSTNVGHVSAQNNYLSDSGHNYMNYAVDANVTVKRANSVSFTGCTFARLGTTGLKLIEGVQNSQISGCDFYEISGGAIQIGDAGFGSTKYNRINDYNPSDIRMLMKNCDVVNNYIHTIATEYRSAAAVGIGQMANAELSYNEIFDIPYSGFHIGYGWNAQFDTIMQNLEVTNNFIHDLMGVGVYDGGAIYTLGNSGGTADNFNLVAYNYIKNQMNGPAALYADNGSTYWSWEENVVDLSMIDTWEYMAGEPKWFLLNTDAHNVNAINNYTTISNYLVASGSTGDVTVSGTQVVENAQWPDYAQTIIANAGLNNNAEQIRNGQIEVVRSNLPNAGTELLLFSGQTFQIELELADGRDNLFSAGDAEIIAYEIYDEKVASVSSDGLVTARGTGASTLCVYVLSNDVLYSIERGIVVDPAEYYSEDFNEIIEPDWIPKNHENATPSEDDLAKAYASIETDPKDTTNKVMKLNISDGRGYWVGAVKELSLTPSIGVLKYRLYLEDNTGTVCLPSFRHVTNGSQGAWFFSVMAVGGKLQLALCQNSNVRYIAYTATEALSDAWHDVTLVQKMDNSAKTIDYALYVDNILVSQGQVNEEHYADLAQANLGMTGVSWSSTWTAGKAYIDDLSVQEGVAATGFVLVDVNGNTSADLVVGTTLQLDATITPSKATCAMLTYSSSDNTVAVVDANGKVTAVGAGTATITATLENCTVMAADSLAATYELNVKSVAEYYSEDYEDITELDWTAKNHSDETPSNYDLSRAYASVETDPKNAANKVMKLNISAFRTQWVGAVTALPSAPDMGVLKYKVYLGDNTGTICLPSFRYVANGSQGSWFFSVMAEGGKLQLALCQACNIRQIVYTSTNVLSDEWHDIALVQKVETGKTLDYTLYVDGALVTEGQLNTENCSYISSANLAMSGLSWSSSWTAGEAYIDGLRVTEYVPTMITHAVTYVADGMTVAKRTVSEGGSVIEIPNLPEKTGYTGVWDHNGNNITTDTTVTAVYTAIAAVKEYNLSLSDDIGMNFYVSVDEANAANTQVEIDVAGKSNTYGVSTLNKDANGNYIVKVNLAAAQMTDTITLKLMVNGEVIHSGEYTVLAYARTILTGDYNDVTKNLVKEMLNYGAAAQTYFNYNAEKLANADIELTDVGTADVPAEAETAVSVSGSIEGISYYGATLIFESKTAIRFYFNVTGDINSYSFNDGALKAVEKNGCWYVETAGINPQDLNEAVTLKVACGDDVITVTYAPLNYMVRMNVNGSDSLKALLKAMYNYHKAAVAYTTTESA